jgi:hypothetical protein
MRRFITRMPIWIRVSAIIALVLVGVVGITMALGAGREGGGHGSGGRMQGMGHESRGGMGMQGGGHQSEGGMEMQGGGHESEGEMQGMDHGSGGG